MYIHKSWYIFCIAFRQVYIKLLFLFHECFISYLIWISLVLNGSFNIFVFFLSPDLGYKKKPDKPPQSERNISLRIQ